MALRFRSPVIAAALRFPCLYGQGILSVVAGRVLSTSDFTADLVPSKTLAASVAIPPSNQHDAIPSYGGESGNGSHASWAKMATERVPTPRQICKDLDRYVVGQAHGKKVLSVAVYNHYMRISHEESRQRQLRHHEEPLQMSRTGSQPRWTPPIGIDMPMGANMVRDMGDYSHKMFDSGSSYRSSSSEYSDSDEEQFPVFDSAVELDKSNVLIMGPTGSGNLTCKDTRSTH